MKAGSIIKSCGFYTEEPGVQKPVSLGNNVKTMKSKDWIAIKAPQGASLEDALRIAKENGNYVVAAEITNGCYAILQKPAAIRGKLPDGWQVLTIHPSKSKPKQVAEAIKSFVTDSSKFTANMTLKEIDANYIYTLEECIVALKDVKNCEDFDSWTAAAKRAKKMDFKEQPEMTPLYKGISCQKEELRRHFLQKEETSFYIMRIKDEKTWQASSLLWGDASDTAKNLKGYMWNIKKQGFEVITLNQYMMTRLHRLAAPVLVGPGSAGRSQIMHAMAKTFCFRYIQRRALPVPQGP